MTEKNDHHVDATRISNWRRKKGTEIEVCLETFVMY